MPDTVDSLQPAVQSHDAADCHQIARSIETLLPALTAFTRFEGPDNAARHRDRWMKLLDRPLPEQGDGLPRVLETLQQIIPYGLRIGHPGFSGFITTGPTSSGIAASLAATVASPQRWCLQPFNYLESLALRWLGDMFGLSEDMQGTFNSGGSVANIIALGAARQGSYERRGFDVAADGLPPGRPARIYASSELHHVNKRAAAILGLGRRSVISVPVDELGRICIDPLRQALERDRAAGVVPVAIVGTAGTVNTGAIDDIAALADLAQEFETWLHIDGCYGMFGILDDRITNLYSGIERADSIAADPHKWLAVPVGCGATFVRDRDLLARTYTLEPAAYLEGSTGAANIESPFDDFGEQYHDLNLEQSSPARGTHVWAVLSEMGRDGMRDRVIRHNDYARRLESLADEHPRLEVVVPPTLSICCFRYTRRDMEDASLNELNDAIVQRMRADGRVVPSTTIVNGKFAIRPCYINPRTREEDVDLLAAQAIRFGDELSA